MTAHWFRPGFSRATGAGRLGSLSATLGAGSSIQVLGALAGFITLPILVATLGGSEFGVLVVVASLAPWLTLVDGALYPATRLLVGESRVGDRSGAPPGLMRSAFRLAIKIALTNLVTLLLGLVVLPLVALFGSSGIVSRSDLAIAVLVFALPIVASGPGGVYLAALEGVGRTVVAATFAGIGPLVALPLTLLVASAGGGLIPLCAVQGLAAALPRTAAWAYWQLRPSYDAAPAENARGGLRIGLVAQMLVLSAAVLIQTGLDPVIVSSYLGAAEAGVFGLANRIVSGALIPLVVLVPLFAANLAAARRMGWSASRSDELRRLVVQAGAAGALAGACVAFLGPLLARVLGAGEVAVPLGLYAAGGAFVFVTFLSSPLYLAFMGPQGLSRSVKLNLLLMVANVGISLVLVRVLGPAGPLWASAAAGLAASGYWLLMWHQHPEWLGEVHPRGESVTRPNKRDFGLWSE